MWNGNNPPSQQQQQQQMGMYTSTTASNDMQSGSDHRQPLPLPPRGSNRQSSSSMMDDQLHMDAVSALTSLQGFAPQLVHTLSSNTSTSVPYVSATTAAMTNPMLQRHYSEDFTTQATPFFGVRTTEDHIVSNGMFNHPYHPSMYGTSMNGGSGGGHPTLQAVLPPQYVHLLPTMNAPPVPSGSLSSSRQASSSSSMAGAVSSLHPNHSLGEMSSSSSTLIYHPPHPYDRPNATAIATNPTTVQTGTASRRPIGTGSSFKTNETIVAKPSVSLPKEDYNEIYHPLHPSERTHDASTEPEDVDDDNVEDDEMTHHVDDAVVAEEVDDDEEEGAEENETIEEEDDDDHDEPEVSVQMVQKVETGAKPRGKPEAAARALAAARLEDNNRRQQKLNEDDEDAPDVVNPPPKKATSRSSNPRKSPTKKAATTNRKKSPISSNGTTGTSATTSVLVSATTFTNSTSKREFLLGEDAPSITDAEYKNLQEMMVQFCRVPLLSEFSRPVAMLHPEVTALYSKIVSHPVDLGHVCRGIRRHHYTNCRDVRLDVWRVFANCVKYNAHSSNKEAVPSFVSIALHLRDYFNNLWQEYLLPSDPPRKPKVLNNTKESIAVFEVAKASFAKRNEERKKRLENSGVLVLSKTFTTNASKLLMEFLDYGGRVDKLDQDPLFGLESGINDNDVDQVIQRLGHYHAQLVEISESGSIEYTLDAFYKDLTKCYTEHVFDEDNQAVQNRFRCRLDRFFWKQAVPLHEANSRGVTQSSIWGNLAATIWARESSKKPFWPALCLGILPPAEQREGWHQAVTERNESRLPEKLRSQLMVAKKRCEQAQKRQSLSYFLVEFLGTHEFIWVRETDIIENFDPNTDPNKSFAGKKSRSTSSVVGSKTYATAIQECVWASEEYENVLQDAFESTVAGENDDDDYEANFTFQTLAQSDDELDQGDEFGYQNDDDNMDSSDVEESNYLISHDGVFDASIAGRKSSKKRSQSLKKQASKKDKDNIATVNRDDQSKKKRSRSKGKSDTQNTGDTVSASDDLERRRKKRLRDHEKSGKSDARKKANNQQQTTSIDLHELDQRLVHNKHSRATAIVKAYLIRLAQQNDNKSLALSGVMTMPSALVDSVGILGMALAFRAASGGLCMPDDGKEQLAKWKPWVVVDTERPKMSSERVHNLRKKIELVESEISNIRSDTKRRQHLAQKYVLKRESDVLAADADDVAARFNHYKKRKKVTPSKSDALLDSEPPVGKISVVNFPEPSLEMDAQGEEDVINDDTDNESIMNEDVAVDNRDQSNPGNDDDDDEDDDAVTTEYDSSETMDVADNE